MWPHHNILIASIISMYILQLRESICNLYTIAPFLITISPDQPGWNIAQRQSLGNKKSKYTGKFHSDMQIALKGQGIVRVEFQFFNAPPGGNIIATDYYLPNNIIVILLINPVLIMLI